MKSPTWSLGIILFLVATTCWSVVILNSTYKKSGFKQAEDLALSPQFSSLIYLSGEEESGSGAWIGNYKGHAYVLTAGHMFPPGTEASDYSYITLDGTEYAGETVFLHPLWNENSEDRTGYDFAIVKLKDAMTDVGPQPKLYSGIDEKGKILTFMGYGWRGAGIKGEDTSLDTEDKPAAAIGLIEFVKNAIEPAPKSGDAGNYFGIWLPREDGSIANPLQKDGIITPVSPLAGILGSGDSGGPAWIQIDSGWVIAGVNSDGSGNAAYGDTSWFARVSQVQAWIKSIIPTVQFSS